MDYIQKAKEILEIIPSLNHSHKRKTVEMVSKGECQMLGMLCINKGELMAGELAKKARVSTARVAAATKSLEEKGYVTREAVEGDRRKTKVIITEAGRHLSEQLFTEAVSHTARYLEYLGEEDTNNLIRIVKKTKGYFEQ